MKTYFAFAVLALVASALAAEVHEKSTIIPEGRISSMCTYPVDAGTVCPGAESAVTHTRYAYNRVEKVCKPFSYNGCGGNSNNFDTHAECSKTCEV